ncbi:Alpha/Beta hydrolase protein [Haematococcus lacustris]
MFANLRNGVHRVGSSSKVPGLRITNHVFRAPLDYSGEHPGEVEVFVRELVSPSHATRKDLPYLLFLQGGPGFESPRPCEASGWIKSAVNSFRVVLMDQRGTGLSSQITVKNLSVNRSPEQQAHYLSFFRADSIVRDAELVRQLLVPKDNYEGRWTLLGQSFGGFCALTYLSLAPEGLIEVLLTGGIPPCIDQACSATEVYRACYLRVLNANQRYYARFPDDVALVQRIVTFLAAQPRGGLLLPSGTRLTPRAFQLMGLSGLGTGGGFERLHYVLESFFDPSDPNEVTPGFIKTFESWMSWDTNPLYALLHESIYCQGAASQWAAQRVLDQEFRSEFDAVETAAEGRPVMLLGEMVFPWMFEDFAGLRPYQEAAQLLASKADWGRLYAPEVLAHNKVPVAAVTYVEDMFVDYHLAQRTASQVQGLRQWLTNEYKHTGIRDDGARILERLLSMVRDTLLLD